MKIAILYNLVDDDDPFVKSENEVLDSVIAIKKSLEPEHDVFPVKVGWDVFDALERFDVVFNLAEGIGRDSKAEPIIADNIKVPYTGSDSRVLRLCNDKGAVKKFLNENGLNVPAFKVFTEYPDNDFGIDFPVIVKPVREHGSLGISSESVVFNHKDLDREVKKIFDEFKEPAICEEYIDGREISASIIGNGEAARVISLSEICFDLSEDFPKILPYEAKWYTESDYYKKTKAICPANVDQKLKEEIEMLALSVYRLIGIRDYGRIDFRVRDDEVFVIDVNPNPCINPTDSGFSMAIKAANISFKEFINMLLGFALNRGRDNDKIKTDK
ncbi:MAG TPA: ATP-grasp domain-containing protein [Halobacteria archaeon]|nr:ATP-grasp domain-containing protein [Halobacteria archaeon]